MKKLNRIITLLLIAAYLIGWAASSLVQSVDAANTLSSLG